MKYCKNCILPDSRPGVVIDEKGICKACQNNIEKEHHINWQEREIAFEKIVANVKKRNEGYDCVIPVSGGKDSTWQVVKCLEYGLKPLTVTWRPPMRTELGQQNLDNLVKLGVDHIDYQINPEVEKKFMLETLRRKGSPAIPMHLAIFSIPVQIAVKFNIPLIIWGENSAFEYGTEDDALTGFNLDSQWLDKFGVSNGTSTQDWVTEDLSSKELSAYFRPSDEELRVKDIKAVFLGSYFKWDVETSFKVAREHGFKERQEGAKMGLYNYADIDDLFISIHHYIKWYKFGMTRTFDNLSLEIRNNRISREDAINLLKDKEDDTPKEDIAAFCLFTGITENDFYQIIEKFRNLDIWYKDDRVWKIRDFLIPDWNWEPIQRSLYEV